MLKIHTVPEGEAVFDKFYKVTVNGESAPLWYARVSAMPFNTPWRGHQRPIDQTEEAPFISFEADGEVRLCVKVEKDFEDIVIRPLSKEIKPTVDGQLVTFTLKTPGAYTFEVDGFHNALHIFFNPPRDFTNLARRESMLGRRVLYYAPGVHEIGEMNIGSHTTVIIEGGAVLHGSITAYGCEDVRIAGYGIIDGSSEIRGDENCLLPYCYDGLLPYGKEEFFDYCRESHSLCGCVRFYRCKQVYCEGVILRDAATFAMIPAGCDNIYINNVKTIGMWRYNSDGIDLFNCSNALVENCFLRDFDDCMVIKGIVGWDDRNNENVVVRGCVLWCDWGRALEIGAETNAEQYRNILFEDCDIIHGSTINMDVQHHNRAEIYNVVFDNIRVEYTKYQLPNAVQNSDSEIYTGKENTGHPMLCAVMMFDMGLFSKDGLHGTAHDIVFKNITVYADKEAGMPVSIVQGIDERSGAYNIRFENISVNGKKITDAESLRLSVNPYGWDIKVS